MHKPIKPIARLKRYIWLNSSLVEQPPISFSSSPQRYLANHSDVLKRDKLTEAYISSNLILHRKVKIHRSFTARKNHKTTNRPEYRLPTQRSLKAKPNRAETKFTQRSQHELIGASCCNLNISGRYHLITTLPYNSLPAYKILQPYFSLRNLLTQKVMQETICKLLHLQLHITIIEK